MHSLYRWVTGMITNYRYRYCADSHTFNDLRIIIRCREIPQIRFSPLTLSTLALTSIPPPVQYIMAFRENFRKLRVKSEVVVPGQPRHRCNLVSTKKITRFHRQEG